MLALPDGSVIVARGGIFETGLGFRNRLQRYTTSGALDLTFGTGGSVILPFQRSDVSPVYVALARQPDGKIVVGGQPDVDGPFALLRLGPNGESDPTFAGGGIAQTNFGISAELQRLAVASNGEILAAGIAFVRDSSSFIAVARYRTDGSLQAAFGSGGKLLLAVPLLDNGALGLFALEDGRVLVVSSSRLPDTTLIHGLLADGTPDPAFGVAGIVQDTRLSAGAAAMDSLGRIVVASGNAITRYLPDGSPDGSFGTGGLVTIANPAFAIANSVAVAPSGSIVLTGIPFAHSAIVLAGYGSGGMPDTRFGSAGILTVGLGKDTTGYSVLAPADGSILIAGEVDTKVGDETFADMFLARVVDTDATVGSVPTLSPASLAVAALALAIVAVLILRRA